jgi:zinc protease
MTDAMTDATTQPLDDQALRDEVRAWLAPQFATGAIEIAIVGDFDTDATIAAVARTLGALPKREAKPALEAERHVTIPPPQALRYEIPTEIPKGGIAFYWPTTDDRDVHVYRGLILLGGILSDRLRVQIREKLGDSYAPQAGSTSSDTYRDYGFMKAFVTIDPAKAKLLDETIAAIADDLAKNGVSEDELARARLPILTGLRESARTNAYWLGSVLASAQEFPHKLEWCRTRYSEYETLGKPAVDALARQYLPSERAIRATIVPEQKQAP